MRGDGARDGKHVAQVRRAILVRRRADRDHLEEAVRDPFGGIERELEPTLGLVASNQLVEPRLVDRDLAAVEALDLLRIDVDANDVIAGVREARARHESHIA